ncbi:BTB/POZ protein [Bombardia bombarda]|uniref:BTB/POZ protein n=1 Tax=Bombardia bombarda TaxID=252184 RepID=A0AA39U4A3_9PEZI|nr:BTB/POZ protein [Bombardia bombarda]
MLILPSNNQTSSQRDTDILFGPRSSSLHPRGRLKMENRFLSSDEKLLESGLFSDVTVKCGDKTWNLHKNILCSRSIWFEKALTGNFEESKTGIVNIQNFYPEAIDWVVRYIYTGVCDIPTLKLDTTTNFITCYEVYTVADYFAMSPLADIALDTLKAELDSKLAPLQMQGPAEYHPSSEWFDELFEAIRLIYQDVAANVAYNNSSNPASQIRAVIINFIHAARFYFLQNAPFNAFLDGEYRPAAEYGGDDIAVGAPPAFALDMFRAMRTTGDFVAHLPEPQCTICRSKPSTRGGEKQPYYTHLAPDKLRLSVSCSACAVKKELPPPTEDWMSKNAAAKMGAGSASG